MAVTSSNKLLYVHLMADWHLNRRLGKPAACFAAGLNEVGGFVAGNQYKAVPFPVSCLTIARTSVLMPCTDFPLHQKCGVQINGHNVGLFHEQVIPSAWLRLFNPKEVNELLSGGEGGGVDAADMQRHATYSGGYSADSQTIKLVWKVYFIGFYVFPEEMLFCKVKCCKMLMHRR